MTLPEALELARRHHEAGEFEPAESLYRQLIAIHPTYAPGDAFAGRTG